MISWMLLKQGDECGSLADFCTPALSVKYSFSNFSFKVRHARPVNSLIVIEDIFKVLMSYDYLERRLQFFYGSLLIGFPKKQIYGSLMIGFPKKQIYGSLMIGFPKKQSLAAFIYKLIFQIFDYKLIMSINLEL